MTGGAAPRRLAALLGLFRDADEIVVGVDESRYAEAAPVLSSVADRLLSYPFGEPGDRPIAWLFAQCSCSWIFNVDDDEVPSRRLLEELPALLARDDITHGWIARRWLVGDPGHYLDEPPWSTEFQLRLVRSGSPFIQFSDEFHRPVTAQGPARFVDAPLWHLDFLVKSFEVRRAKALAYERDRRGMRIAGIAHNTGLYLPELRPGVRTAAVPEDERRRIERVLEGAESSGGRRAVEERASREDVDRHWPGPPFPNSLYEARLELRARPDRFIAGVQQTVDVLVENRSDTVWRWGKEAQPEIRVGYHWLDLGGTPVGGEGLRTPLPSDLGPAETQIVPVHVVGPESPGRYRLELDLVHEHVRWFGCGVAYEAEVVPRRRVAVVGGTEEVLDALALVPELEPVLVERDAVPSKRFGLPRVAGPGSYLGTGDEGASRLRLLGRAYALRRAVRQDPSDLFLQQLAQCEALVVAGHDWPAGAAETRELWRLAVTVDAARRLGVDVLLVDGALPRFSGRARTTLVREIHKRATFVGGVEDLVTRLRRAR